MPVKAWNIRIGTNMTNKKVEECGCENCHCQSNNSYTHSGGGAVYGIGILGAAFYFFSSAVGVSGFFLALFKSLAWPAILVYQALSLLKL